MNNGIQRRERQLKKYTSHAIASCVAKHFLYTLGVYYFSSLTLSVCMSVCMSVTLLLQIDSSFFVSRWNQAILAIISPCGTLQNCFLRFWI